MARRPQDLLGARDPFSKGLMPNVTNTNRMVPNEQTMYHVSKYSGMKKKFIAA